jgi:hypothetical protein
VWCSWEGRWWWEGRSKGDRHGRKRNGDEGAFGFVQRRAPETANGLYALRPRGNLTSPRCPIAVDGKAESRGRGTCWVGGVGGYIGCYIGELYESVWIVIIK